MGALSSFLTYANQYTKPFNEISGVVAELQSAMASARRVFEVIDFEEQTPDAENAAILQNARGDIEIENVDFSYREDVPLIENFNLRARPGQRVAIVGPTGCGKTTIINLLMRFYDVRGGEIRVDGHPVMEVTRDSLRACLLYTSVLRQRPHADGDEQLHKDGHDAREVYIVRADDEVDGVAGEDGHVERRRHREQGK